MEESSRVGAGLLFALLPSARRAVLSLSSESSAVDRANRVVWAGPRKRQRKSGAVRASRRASLARGCVVGCTRAGHRDARRLFVVRFSGQSKSECGRRSRRAAHPFFE